MKTLPGPGLMNEKETKQRSILEFVLKLRFHYQKLPATWCHIAQCSFWQNIFISLSLFLNVASHLGESIVHLTNEY